MCKSLVPGEQFGRRALAVEHPAEVMAGDAQHARSGAHAFDSARWFFIGDGSHLEGQIAAVSQQCQTKFCLLLWDA